MPLNHRDLWDTRYVKSQLAARAMPEWKTFLYFLALTTFDWLQFTAVRIMPAQGPVPASFRFEAWFGLGITVVALVYLFFRNGGARGRDFLYRYFPLAVLVGWKVVVVIVAALWAARLVLEGQPESVTRWSAVAIACLLNVFMFLRIGHHLKELCNAESS